MSMIQSKKQNIDYFPKWKPQMGTLGMLSNISEKVRYKALRNSSSAFIKRMDVRSMIFSRDGYKCVICGSSDDLQIDHIHSVYSVIKGKFPIEKLNTIENLRTLCMHCNASKIP